MENNRLKTVGIVLTIAVTISMVLPVNTTVVGNAPAETQITTLTTVGYSFLEPQITNAGTYDRIVMDGSTSGGAVGEPVIPYKSAKILLPQGEEFTDVKVTVGTPITLPGTYLIAPGQEPVRGDKEPGPATPPNPNIYSSSNPYPGDLYFVSSIQWCRGYQMLLLNLYPLQYVPAARTIYYYPNMDVIVTTTPTGTMSPLYRGMERDRDRVLDIVDNPWTVSTYESAVSPLSAENPSTFLPPDSYDYVIITDTNMVAAFQPLADYKTGKGVNATIYTLQDIYATYAGVDDQDKIRNFIIDAYTTWGITYVLLGADTLGRAGEYYLPHRGFNYTTDTDIPSDLYYACLDGNWNLDGDDYWGETGEEDYYAEVYVGRAPVGDSTQATTFVNKVISYEGAPKLKKAVLHGALLSEDTYTEDIKDIGDDDPVVISPNVGVDDFIPADWTLWRQYESLSTATKANWTAGFTEGHTFMNHGNHGNPDHYDIVSGVPFTKGDAMALTNTYYPIALSIACYSGAFDGEYPGGAYTLDRDCLAEAYILNPNGGCSAAILNSRFGWYGGPGEPVDFSGELDIEFYRQVFDQGHDNIGVALQKTREVFAPAAAENTWEAIRWCLYAWNLLGDPEMPITDSPPNVTVNVPDGGEVWSGTENILYTAIDPEDGADVTIDIDYSPNGGTDWYNIVTGTANTGSYSWDTTTVSEGTNYLIKVTAQDTVGLTGEDESNAVFTIHNMANLAITNPDETAPDQILSGFVDITWTATDPEDDDATLDIKIEYSADGGSSWTTIEDGTNNNDGIHPNWDTTVLSDGVNYVTRINATNSVPLTTSKTTVPFSIDNTADDEWFLQVQKNAWNEKNLSMQPVELTKQSETTDIPSAGQHLLGAWVTDNFTTSKDVSGAWTFNIYGYRIKAPAAGKLYAKIFNASNKATPLNGVQQRDDEDISSYTSEGNTHKFTWQDSNAVGTIGIGHAIYVEIWLDATDGQPDTPTEYNTNQDIVVEQGSQSGDHTDTWTQNDGYESITEADITQSLSFSDGFESGDFDAGGWETSNYPIVSTINTHTGFYSAGMRVDEVGMDPTGTGTTLTFEKALSTDGQENIQFEYWRFLNEIGTDGWIRLYVDWFDGSSWHFLELQMGSSPWTQKTHALPVAADDNPNFKVRFNITHASFCFVVCNEDNNEAWVDDVLITGTGINRGSLEHKWTIDLTDTEGPVTFYIDAYQDDTGEGDDFIFAYSTDDVGYTDMVTVSATSDTDTYLNYVMPNSVAGDNEVFIRVVDTVLDGALADVIHIDHMYIEATLTASRFVIDYDYGATQSSVEPSFGGVPPSPYDIPIASTGWQFVSFPYVGINGDPAVVFNDSINGDGLTTWDYVQYYDATDPTDPWKTYATFKPAPLNDFANVDYTMGVWIHILTIGDGVLTTGMEGAYFGSTVNINLYTGWNLVGYPSATSRLASATLPAEADMIAVYDPAQTYDIRDETDLTLVTMSEGNAYWVHVTANCTWNIDP